MPEDCFWRVKTKHKKMAQKSNIHAQEGKDVASDEVGFGDRIRMRPQ